MSWTWRLESMDGAELDNSSVPSHGNQADAETWLGENWRELVDLGAGHVTLLDGDRVVYRMSLSEE